jgi:hypothetical protein
MVPDPFYTLSEVLAPTASSSKQFLDLDEFKLELANDCAQKRLRAGRGNRALFVGGCCETVLAQNYRLSWRFRSQLQFWFDGTSPHQNCAKVQLALGQQRIEIQYLTHLSLTLLNSATKILLSIILDSTPSVRMLNRSPYHHAA